MKSLSNYDNDINDKRYDIQPCLRDYVSMLQKCKFSNFVIVYDSFDYKLERTQHFL